MLPFSSGLDLSSLNALRSMMFGGGPMHGVPPGYGSAPPMRTGGFNQQPAPQQPDIWGGAPPRAAGPPMQPPFQMPTFGSNPPMNLANLMALRSLGPQAQNGMRFPMTPQF